MIDVSGIGVHEDRRLPHAKRVCEQLFGSADLVPWYDEWLSRIENPPLQPEAPELDTLILAPSPRSFGLVKACELLGVRYLGDDTTLVDFAEREPRRGFYWMWAHNGVNNCRIKPKVCRGTFFNERKQLTLGAWEGIWLYAADPTCLDYHDMFLAASVHAEARDNVAVLLKHKDGTVELTWGWDEAQGDRQGCATRHGLPLR
ncbi:MAG: hypothetical protein ABIA47_04995 [bacterium]